MMKPSPNLIEYNKLKILNLQENNLQDEIVNFLKSFNKPIESNNKNNDFRSTKSPNVIELKINEAVYRLKLIEVNNTKTTDVQDGGDRIIKALNIFYRNIGDTEEEAARPCKEFKKALDNSKTKILVKRNGEPHGYIVKVDNNE